MPQLANNMPNFFKLKNTIQNYAWGSKTLMPELFELSNDDNQPMAEMCMGAHPGGCSQITTQQGNMLLSEFIAQDKKAVLADKTATDFGELPYLLKVLTAESALSIQVHPDKRSAQAGYSREQEAGIALSDFCRNYKDPNHKPELVYALGEFQAMNGFRDYSQILALFRQIEISALADLVEEFANNQTAKGLEAFFVALLELNGTQKQQAITELSGKIDTLVTEQTFALVKSLLAQYPDDIGVFSPLFLHVITLQAGQSMYLDARTPHAYIKGACIEIMANSDNVLRAGLTSKHMDIEELVNCTSFEPKPIDSLLLNPEQIDGRLHYPVSVKDFALEVLDQANSSTLKVNSAEIILALESETVLEDSAGQCIVLNKGESAFVPAYASSYQVQSQGKVIRAFNH